MPEGTLPRRWLSWLVPAVVCALLAACAGPAKKEPADGPSTMGITAADVPDAVPRKEPLAKYGNHSPYEVFGRRYTVMKSSAGYHERGIASWYGSKFHGRRTSSGEPFDMHKATAAHRSLPLPTYAEVRNLDNGRTVIVKINDRGPFKDNRLIDLSYGAALRLGMTQTGTARVEVRVIDPDAPQRMLVAAAPSTGGTFLQVGAYGQRGNAEELAHRLQRSKIEPVSIDAGGGLYRVWLGPFASDIDIERTIQRAVDLGFDRPHRVKR